MPDEPPVKNVMAFIDGQNLYRHAKEAFGYHHPNYDPQKLHAAICKMKGWRPTLVRFYTGVPSTIESPMWSAYWSNRVLAMKRIGIHVTTRPIRYHKEIIKNADQSEQIITTPQEKGIDVRIALDTVKLARKRQYDVALIFSQDQDLAEIVEEIHEISVEQNRWLKVACAFPAGPNASYDRGIPNTDWIEMDKTFYDACLDPKDYRPRNARST